MARKAYDHGYGFTDSPELPNDWHADAAAKLTRLGLYADRRVATAASVAYGAAWSWGQNTKYDDPDDPKFYERQQRYDDAELELLVLMREALSIPEADLTLPPPGYTYDASRPNASDGEGGPRPDSNASPRRPLQVFPRRLVVLGRHVGDELRAVDRAGRLCESC